MLEKIGQLFYMHSIELSFVEGCVFFFVCFLFFCSIMEWDKRSYEGKYDSVKVGTAENQTVMP